MRCLDVVQRCQQRFEHAPLIDAQTVDHDENRFFVAHQHRYHKFGNHVDGQGRTIALQLAQPTRILRLHERRKLAMHVGIQPAQRLVQSKLAGVCKVDVPLHQLCKAIDPAAPIQRGIAIRLDGAKALDKSPRQRLRANQRTFKNSGDHRQHLPRRHRLDHVLADVCADGLLERRVFLTLGDHHHGQIGRQLANLFVRGEAAGAGHLLVEQDQVICLATQHFHGVVGVGGRIDVVALVSEQESVRLEQFRLVIHPENRFCRLRHMS